MLMSSPTKSVVIVPGQTAKLVKVALAGVGVVKSLGLDQLAGDTSKYFYKRARTIDTESTQNPVVTVNHTASESRQNQHIQLN